MQQQPRVKVKLVKFISRSKTSLVKKQNSRPVQPQSGALNFHQIERFLASQVVPCVPLDLARLPTNLTLGSDLDGTDSVLKSCYGSLVGIGLASVRRRLAGVLGA
ncbi:hypothetical protein ISCGN_022669 [Ixodes scapularis]